MKLGSLVNHLYSRMTVNAPEPIVGMGCTFLGYTDRKAGTIHRVFKIGKDTAIECSYDDAKRIDTNGMSEIQEYEFTPRPDSYRQTFRRNAKGKWQEVFFNADTKRWNRLGGAGLLIDKRDHYEDFSF